MAGGSKSEEKQRKPDKYPEGPKKMQLLLVVVFNKYFLGIKWQVTQS